MSTFRFLMLLLLPFSTVGAGEPPLALLQKPGHIAIARHALAPGMGDPADFELGDCRTQRNLSDEGRAQATRMGDAFRQAGINQAAVYTSQWCRCRDTAILMELGKVTELPSLNSFFQEPNKRGPQMKALEAWLEDRPKNKPVVLITHQVVITALTGVFPSSGEILILHPNEEGGWEVAARIETRI